jgi:hypothetical protein
MRKARPRTVAAALVALAAIAALATVLSIRPWSSAEEERAKEVDASYVSELHMRLDPKDIPELKEIVRLNPDSDTRARAISVMTDIAMRKNVTEEVIDFLKGTASDEEDAAVRSHAYANLDLIREFYPLETRGDLSVRVEGEVKEGSSITLVATASSTVDIGEATVGVRRLAQDGYEQPVDIRLDSPNPVRFPLKTGETKEASFEVYLGKEGRYLILLALTLDLDKVDSQTIEKEVYLAVGKTAGTFEVAPEETEAEPEETP